MKVLIVDDEEINRRILKTIITRLGHEVIETSDGAMAWDEFLRSRPRAIVSDWVMPNLSGPELCHKIREKKGVSYTYFILLTGKMMDPKNTAEAMEKGVDDFLIKPVNDDELLYRLRVAERILGLTQRVQDLENIVPICSYCKRIRRDDGTFQAVEIFVQSRSEMSFSHGICPDCMAKNFPHHGT